MLNVAKETRAVFAASVVDKMMTQQSDAPRLFAQSRAAVQQQTNVLLPSKQNVAAAASFHGWFSHFGCNFISPGCSVVPNTLMDVPAMGNASLRTPAAQSPYQTACHSSLSFSISHILCRHICLFVTGAATLNMQLYCRCSKDGVVCLQVQRCCVNIDL